jgi:hypothetical protein
MHKIRIHDLYGLSIRASNLLLNRCHGDTVTTTRWDYQMPTNFAYNNKLRLSMVVRKDHPYCKVSIPR